jgi:hypothetical protein
MDPGERTPLKSIGFGWVAALPLDAMGPRS